MNLISKRTPHGVIAKSASGGRPPISAEKADLFLHVLAKTHQVREAAHAAGVGRTALYRRRAEDPEFRAAWEAAMATLPDAVMDAVVRMAKLDDESPELAATFKLFDKFHGRAQSTVAVQVNQHGDGGQSVLIDQQTEARLEAELLRRLLPADAIAGTFAPVEPGVDPVPSPAVPDDDSVEDLL